MNFEKARFVLCRYVAAKKEHKESYSQLIQIAVEEFGLPQEIAKQVNVADWVDGFLAANGIYGDRK